ncbi:MAG: hypothetical protein DRJ33_03850 [Candidatus Methanomethylicota archaeon]|uniref:Arginase n=1 Tax=Thermoproteota archaeon TaxID=2056631 RepID=A0A497EZ29_9CREN|nr:MAG: hypothetical protein DRJ33_03850 [Candidatus Verstraetearchaeota archaeon]
MYEVFGISLDPDEGLDSIRMKTQLALSGFRVVEPYDAIVEELRDWAIGKDLVFKGKVDVESWLTPNPTVDDLILLTPEGIVAFLDTNGCLEYRRKVADFVKDNISDKPVMIGIDHSMTGGVLDALTERYGSAELGVIVFDSHFDAISSNIRNKLVEYAREKSPDKGQFGLTPFDYVYYPEGRKDAYLCGSFLKFLIEEGVIKAENLVVYGPLDYPDAKVREISDLRVKEYVEAYLQLERQGVTIVPRSVIDRNGVIESLKYAISKLDAQNIYISVDIDIMARRPVLGAKFIDIEGISELEFYCLVDFLKKVLDDKIVGFDIVEIEPLRAGGTLKNGKPEPTYSVVGNIIREFVSGEVEVTSDTLNALAKLKAGERLERSLEEELIARGFVKQVGKKLKVSEEIDGLNLKTK